MNGHVCVVIPVGKCFPDVLQAVLARVIPAVDDRRDLTVINAYAAHLLGELRGGRFDIVSKRAPSESHLPALLRWTADLVDEIGALKGAGRHVLLVGPYYVPGFVWLYDKAVNHCADGVLAIGAAEDFSLVSTWGPAFSWDGRATILSYEGFHEPYEVVWPDDMPRFDLGMQEDLEHLDGGVFRAIAGRLGIPEIGGPPGLG